MSQSIIVLNVSDAASLARLYHQAHPYHSIMEIFREPDLGDEITAIAFLPGTQNIQLLSNLPLAGKVGPDQVTVKAQKSLQKLSFEIQDTEAFMQGQVLRECYVQYLKHLRGHDVMSSSVWSQDKYNDQDRKVLLHHQPDFWVVDRALTFWFMSSVPEAYALDRDALDAIRSEPFYAIPGWQDVLDAYEVHSTPQGVYATI